MYAIYAYIDPQPPQWGGKYTSPISRVWDMKDLWLKTTTNYHSNE